ncbi:hypothetical protein CPB86DRAFT_811743 [Serendipita vermifera]|nr:hypothetical protein CPB86DRAFT_811743 [Serendipita vermifera]
MSIFKPTRNADFLRSRTLFFVVVLVLHLIWSIVAILDVSSRDTRRTPSHVSVAAYNLATQLICFCTISLIVYYDTRNINMNANAPRAWLSHTFFEIAVYILLTILQLAGALAYSALSPTFKCGDAVGASGCVSAFRAILVGCWTVTIIYVAFTCWFTTSVVLVARRDPAVWTSRSKTYDWEAAYGKPPSLLDDEAGGRRGASPLEVVLGPPSEKGTNKSTDGKKQATTTMQSGHQFIMFPFPSASSSSNQNSANSQQPPSRPEAKRSRTWNDYFPTRWTGPRPRLESTPHLPIQSLPPPTPFDTIPPVPALPTEPVPALVKSNHGHGGGSSIGNGSEMKVNMSTPIMEHDHEHEHEREHERERERERYFEQDLQRQMQQSPVAHSASSHHSHSRDHNRTPTNRDNRERANPSPVPDLDMNQMPVSPLDVHLNEQPKGVPEDISLSGTPYSGFRPLSIVQSLWSHRRSQTYPQAGQDHHGYFHHHRPPPPVPPIPEQYRQQASSSVQAQGQAQQKDGRKGILSIRPLKLGRGRVSVDKTMIGMPKAITLTVNGPAIDGASSVDEEDEDEEEDREDAYVGMTMTAAEATFRNWWSPEQSFALPSPSLGLPASVRSHSRGMSLDSGINNNNGVNGGVVITSPHTSYSASKYSSGLKSIGLGANGRFSVDEMGRLPSLPPRSPLGGVLEEERSATPSVQGSRKDEINVRAPAGAGSTSAKGSNGAGTRDIKGRGAEYDPNYLFPVANTISSVASRSSRYSTGAVTIPPTPPPKDKWRLPPVDLDLHPVPVPVVSVPPVVNSAPPPTSYHASTLPADLSKYNQQSQLSREPSQSSSSKKTQKQQQSPLSREPSQSHSSSSKQTQKQSQQQQQQQQQRSTPPLVRSYSARTQQTYVDSSGGEQRHPERRVRSPTGYI